MAKFHCRRELVANENQSRCVDNPRDPGNCSIIYEECKRGFYGKYCDSTCACDSDQFCGRLTGECLDCDKHGKNCAAASDEHSHMNIIIVAIAVICAVMIALILLFIMRRVIVHRQDTKHQRSKGAARLMLNPEEVIFHRDPITGVPQAYCTIGPRRNLEGSTSMGVNLGSPSSCSEKDQQPMRVALPPEMNFRGYSTVPHKNSYGDNLKGPGQRVELPYMVPVVSRNPFQHTVPNDYSLDNPPPSANLPSSSHYNPFTNEPINDARASYDSGTYETIRDENLYEEMNYASLYETAEPKPGSVKFSTLLHRPTEPSVATLSRDTYGNSNNTNASRMLSFMPRSESSHSEHYRSPSDTYGAQMELYGSQNSETYS
ncbi:uncharacterized protein LOC134842923 [Symsagittifera roscoffensis]|uniref:uncharacterized protein LOC134842923 n=1 Tax=Symsagittifera roscoffensis TaxID=84072 RepID=UPI00307C9821